MSDRDLSPCYQVLMIYMESRLPQVLRAQLGISDVVQSVFRVAEARSGQFRGESSKEYQRWLIRIAELPAGVRMIVMLRYARELTFAEIGERMELSESTCQRRWFEGVELLGERLYQVLR